MFFGGIALIVLKKKSFFARVYVIFVWNCPITFFLMNFLDGVFYLCMGIVYLPKYSNVGKINIIASFAYLITMILLIYLIIRTLAFLNIKK